MLSYMRENAGSWIIKVLFGIIVIVFVFFYGFSDVRKGDQNMVIARVGDREISQEQYQMAYKNTIEMYRTLYKNQLNDELMEKLGLRQKVLDDLINRELLLQEAERRNIRVSQDDVRAAIMAMPMFQDGGRFSEGLYQRALNYYGITAADFENDKERELILRALENIISLTAKISDKEVRDRYRMQKEKVKIDYVCISPDTIKEEFAIADADIKGYYDRNKEQFREPEKVKVKYLVFDPAAFEEKVEVPPQELQVYYELDSDRFSEPRQVRARHILLKSDSPEKASEVFKKAEELAARLKKGEDFAGLAEKVSEDTATADKGGDLGYFKKGDMVKPLEDAAFALQPGDISQPVKGTAGWHIIKVEDIKEARVKPLDEVKDVIGAEVRRDRAQELAEKEARRAFNRLFKSRDLEGFAAEAGMKVQESGFFAYGQGPEDQTGKEAFSKEAFALARGELSGAFAVGQKFYLLRLEAKRESQIPPLEEVRAAIIVELEKDKKLEAAKVTAERVLMDLAQGEKKWEAAAKKNGLEIKEAEVGALGEYIPGIGQSREIRDAAFGLDQAKPYGPAPYRTDKGMVIIKLRERVAPSDEDFAKEKQSIEQSLLQAKRQELFEQFLQSLKAGAETWVNPKFSATL